MTKYIVTTKCLYTDTVEVEADSEDEAESIAHEIADYQYDCWFDADAVEVQNDYR